MMYSRRKELMKKKLIAATTVAGLTLALGTAGVASAHDRMSGKGNKEGTVLKGLVEKGTLTQAQLDAITKAMTEAREAGRAAHEAAHAERAKLISDTLGIDDATIKSRLQAGETLAAIAGSKKDALIDALVAFESKKIDAAVTAGKLTAAQATDLKANLKTRITSQIESTKGKGMAGKKGKGHGRGGH